MARSLSFSIDNAWNSVALEERLELINRAHASGIISAVMALLLFGTVGYGLDQIWVLYGGFGAVIFVVPLFTSFRWRKDKPQLILAYLAVRTVARRYGYGHNIRDLEPVLIFRGMLEEEFSSMEEEMLYRQRETVDFDTQVGGSRPVWISLMRGGLVLMSERLGGAKLEYATAFAPDVTCRKREKDGKMQVLISGSGPAKGRTMVISSNYSGALYVFERQTMRLIKEVQETTDKMNKLRQQQFIEDTGEGIPQNL